MGRLVEPAQQKEIFVRRDKFESLGTETRVNVGGDGYSDRIAKYIPGEVIAAYIALDRQLIPSPMKFNESLKAVEAKAAAASQSAETMYEGLNNTVQQLPVSQPDASLIPSLLPYLPLGLLALGVIFTPLYIRQLAKNAGAGTPWVTQAVMSTLAFIVWAYSIQGSAFLAGKLEGLYSGSVAAALVVVFTLASGVFGPAPVRVQ